jgi:hypothetical protein
MSALFFACYNSQLTEQELFFNDISESESESGSELYLEHNNKKNVWYCFWKDHWNYNMEPTPCFVHYYDYTPIQYHTLQQMLHLYYQ